MDGPEHYTGFIIGDRVKKVSGYTYLGTIVSIFTTLDGKQRYVVENTQSRGMLHIFNKEQLAHDYDAE